MTAPQAGASDIPTASWVDRWAPLTVRPYLRLMRLDRPIGTWLLLFPCWWGLALAPLSDASDWRGVWLAALFTVGAVVMRGAGCTVNDILDRRIDAKVQRTRTRPIPSGQVSVRQAVAFLAAQLLVGLVILLQFNTSTILLGVASLALVFPYPLMKRITWWPQLWLGLTFNWGALMGWSAVTGGLDWPALALYAAGVFWTLGYDTVYAHQDKEDDARIGVKSTALRLGDRSRWWIAAFYLATILLIGAALVLADAHWLGGLLMVAALAQLSWQVVRWVPDDPVSCLAVFKSNKWFGLYVLIALGSARLLAS